MKSKASIKSHPLHPILVAFPIAFFTGTLFAHAGGWLLDRPALLYTATLLNTAGVVAAIAAAVPGFIDYLYTVPPKSSAKERAAKHGLINTTMLVLFVIAAVYRQQDNARPYLVLALEIAGLVLLIVAGWMGGTLVYRNQIGVDHRYAGAGKWNESYFDADTGIIDVGGSDELKVNAMKLLHLKTKRIVLARTQDGFFAFDDRCTHKGGSMADGSLACGIVQCPWHGSQFSVQDGSVTVGPAKEGIKTYPVSEANGRIMLALDSPSKK